MAILVRNRLTWPRFGTPDRTRERVKRGSEIDPYTHLAWKAWDSSAVKRVCHAHDELFAIGAPPLAD